MECTELLSEFLNNKKDWIDILSALLTPTIAIIAVVIGIFQWRVNHARLKHELFDRRYKQFDAVKEFLGSFLANGEATLKAQRAYLIGTSGISFTFSDEISKYLQEKIWLPVIKLTNKNKRLKKLSDGDEREALVEEIISIDEKLNHEFSELENRFKPYLQLESRFFKGLIPKHFANRGR